MAISPYGLIGGQQSVLESLIKSEQGQKEAQAQTGMQMGGMRREFQAETDKAMKEAEALLAQQFAQSKSSKDKGRLFGGISSLLSTFLPGLGSALGALFSGFGSYEQMKEQKEHEINKVLAAQAASKINQGRWGKTFLGEKAKDFESTMTRQLSAAEERARGMFGSKSDMRKAALKTGVASGLTSLAMGQAMKGFGKGIKKRVAFKEGLPKGMKMKDVRLARRAIKKGIRKGDISKDALQDILQPKTVTTDITGLDPADIGYDSSTAVSSDIGYDPSTAVSSDVSTLGLSPDVTSTLSQLPEEQLMQLLGGEGVGGPIQGIL